MNYSTPDIYLAGYLMASDQSLTSTSDQGSSMIFEFAKTDRLTEMVEKYYKLQAQVNPQRYGYALKVLKNLLYRSLNENKNNDRQYMFNKQRKGN